MSQLEEKLTSSKRKLEDFEVILIIWMEKCKRELHKNNLLSNSLETLNQDLIIWR